MGWRPLHRECVPELRLTGGACVMGALWLLTVPPEWLGAAVLAALWHETGHLIALRWMKISVRRVAFGAFGAGIETAPMEPRQELLAAAAGPAAGLLLALGWQVIPRCAVCALVQSAWNLLPVFPMDGGRMMVQLSRILHAGRQIPVAKNGISEYNDSD